MADTQSVLIVDRSEETREVLSTVLQRRGVRTFSADKADRGVEMARQVHPDLIVLDLELDDSAGNAADPFTRESTVKDTPMVLLGSVRRTAQRLPGGEFVSKPYHYGPLIRRIEEILAAH